MSLLKQEVQVLWRLSALLMGVSLPLILLGRAITVATLLLGVIFGLMATSGTSLRSSVMLLAKSTLVRLIGIFVLAVGASVVFAIDQGRALDQLMEMLIVLLAATGIFIALREMPSRYTRLTVQDFSLTLVGMIVLAMLDAFLGDARLSNAIHGEDGASAARLHFFSSTLAVMLPFMWAWFFRQERERVVLAHWLALPVSLVGFWAVFVSGGRAGWVAAVVAAIVFLAMAGRYHGLILHARHWLFGLISFAVGPVLYGVSQGFDHMMSRVNIVAEANGAGGGRLDIWKFAIEHLFDNPLTGIGIENFRLLQSPEGLTSNMHPHNFVLQLALETGIFGLLAASVMILYLLWTFFRYAKKDLYGLAGLCSLIAFFTASLANTSIFHAWWLTFLVFPLLLAGRTGWSGK
jgi:O-antigen ligase